MSLQRFEHSAFHIDIDVHVYTQIQAQLRFIFYSLDDFSNQI